MTLVEYLGFQYGLFRRLVSGRDVLGTADRSIVTEFHKLYYDRADTGGTWQDTYWMGCKILKCPLDMWVYQEILHETKPDLVIETGTYNGGSASTASHFACDIVKGASYQRNKRFRIMALTDSLPTLTASCIGEGRRLFAASL